ncbi:MAG: hypothetical protein ACFFDO_07090 [Candidatus Thorarchaeota archaeon]
MVVELDPISQLSGLLAFIQSLFSLTLGAIILHKAIRKREKMLFYFFFAVIFIMSPWYPSGFGYVYWLFTGNVFSYQVYVLMGTIFIPVALIAWLEIYMSTLHPKKKKLVLICFTILFIIFYIYLFYFLFFAPDAPIINMIGIQHKPNDITYRSFVIIFLAFCIVVTLFTGINFSIISMNVIDNPTVIWKGRFLLISFILFPIGAFGDALIEYGAVDLIIFRTIIVLSMIFYYIGFLMPKWMKKILSLE